jgi:ABC-type uncharacterized transport system auxiliary subunit
MTRIRFDGCDLSPRSARAPRFAQPTAAVALAVLLAGCGGSGRMTKTDYERTINDSGRKLSVVFGTVDQGTANLNQVAVRATRARRTLLEVTRKLERLKPPTQAERAHQSLVIALTTLSTDLQRLERAAESGYPKAVVEARARLSAPGRQLIAAIQQLQQAGYAIKTG